MTPKHLEHFKSIVNKLMVLVLEFQLGAETSESIFVDTDHILFISICLYVFVWRSHCLKCSASTLLTPSKWQNLFLFFFWANASAPPSPLCSILLFGADILTHHWSSHQTNGNLPACWNYWWLSLLIPPQLPTPPLHHKHHTWLTASLQQLLLCSFLLQQPASLMIDFFLHFHLIFEFPYIHTTEKVICLCLLKQAIWQFYAHVGRRRSLSMSNVMHMYITMHLDKWQLIYYSCEQNDAWRMYPKLYYCMGWCNILNEVSYVKQHHIKKAISCSWLF